MNTDAKKFLPIVLILAAAAVLSSVGTKGCSLPSVAKVERPPAGPDLLAVFAQADSKTEARAHAHAFATICGTLADVVEDDANLKPEPRLKTGAQLDDMRLALRVARMRSWSFSAKYPKLGAAVGEYLTKELGDSGRPLDDAQRKRWVDAMRAVRAQSLFAEANL